MVKQTQLGTAWSYRAGQHFFTDLPKTTMTHNDHDQPPVYGTMWTCLFGLLPTPFKILVFVVAMYAATFCSHILCDCLAGCFTKHTKQNAASHSVGCVQLRSL